MHIRLSSRHVVCVGPLGQHAKDDPEKLLTPAIVFCNLPPEDGWCAAGIAIGWWHWGVKLMLVWEAQ